MCGLHLSDISYLLSITYYDALNVNLHPFLVYFSCPQRDVLFESIFYVNEEMYLGVLIGLFINYFKLVYQT